MNNIIKIVLITLGVVLAAMLVFPLLGIVLKLVWLAFWVTLIGFGIYGAYKFFTKDSKPKGLTGRESFSLGGFEESSIDQSWEEIKSKYMYK
jgi:FtsH-binding integral membrane protein